MSTLDLARRKTFSKLAFGALGGSLVYLLALHQIIGFISAHPGHPLNLWIAALPIAGLMLVLVLAMRSLQGMDELVRQMHTEAMAFAFLASLVIIGTCGFLALAGLMKLSVGWLAPSMVICWIIGLMLAIRRYR